MRNFDEQRPFDLMTNPAHIRRKSSRNMPTQLPVVKTKFVQSNPPLTPMDLKSTNKKGLRANRPCMDAGGTRPDTYRACGVYKHGEGERAITALTTLP